MPILALFLIDPPERLDPPTDTTLAIMRESLQRGQRVCFATLDGLRLRRGVPQAAVREVEFPPGAELFRSGSAFELNLAEDCDVVWMRKDPPVDLAYLHATYILDFLPSRVLQVNPARSLRNFCEKLAPARFAGLQPDSLVTRSVPALVDFVARYGKIVVKPLEDCSGHGIVVMEKGTADLEAGLRRATEDGTRFVQGQEFLPEIVEGDIRVLMLGGEILGWVRRVPATGDFRSNINAGGRCVPCPLDAADRALCNGVAGWLKKESIHLAGVDIVAGRVLEINLTSPSCLREINQLYGLHLEREILDYVMQLLQKRDRQ
jgi:glutathione synthase